MRLGREPARPRRRGVPRRARRGRAGAGGGRPGLARLRRRAPGPQRVGPAGRRNGAAPAGGDGQRRVAHRGGRGRRSFGRGAQRVGAAALPARRPGRRRRGAAVAAPLSRPAARADAAQPPAARRRQPRAAGDDARAGFRRGRDAAADRVDTGRCARFRRPVAAAARFVLRAAPESAAVQAAADGRRPRPLLPDRALLA